MMSTPDWLELAEAAQILGIHQSTLRRWADAGKIAHMRTLSGRRRFERQVILQAYQDMTGRKQTPQQPAQETAQLETQTLNLARQRTHDLSNHPTYWFQHLNEEQRLLFRYSGQRLLGLMMQFISRMDSADTFLAEGKRVAGDYGRICYHAGLSISQTAEAFLFFRRSILESVQATTGLDGPHDLDGQRVFLRTIDFFDNLLIATIESYATMEQ